MAESKLSLYGHPISQPYRAVKTFLISNNIPFNDKEINVFKGAHYSEEYQKINSLGLIPAIDDDGFYLSESPTILRYLVTTRNVPEKWYPKDPKKRAVIDRYLDWHPSNIRGCAKYLQALSAHLFPKGYVTWTVEDAKKNLDLALTRLDEVFLNGKKYIGGDEITIADLPAASEVVQLSLVNYKLSEYPNVEGWMKRMMENETFRKVTTESFSRFQKAKL